MAFRAKWSGLIFGLYRSSFILLPFPCLKHRHQNACHENRALRLEPLLLRLRVLLVFEPGLAVAVAAWRSPLLLSADVCRRLSLFSPVDSTSLTKLKRDSLLRYACKATSALPATGESIQAGIFRRLPMGSTTATAPSLFLGLLRTRNR